MLAIRLQRTGRSGHAQFRVIVQDSHRHPTRGKIVSYLGSYNPHTKEVQIDKEAAQKFLDNGAQPSDRAVSLLKKEGVKLPAWVQVSAPGKRTTRNPEKRRSTRPEELAAPANEPAAEEPATETSEAEAPVEASTEVAEAPAEESTTEETSSEQPAEEPAAETAAEAPAEPTPAEQP